MKGNKSDTIAPYNDVRVEKTRNDMERGDADLRRMRRQKIRRRRFSRFFFALFVLVIVGVGSCINRAESSEESIALGAEVEHQNKTDGMSGGFRKRKFLIQNLSQIPDELKETLSKYPETLPFVLGYPGPEEKPEIQLAKEWEQGTIPLLIQWDCRWGYEPYGDSMIGISGCGPTCLSMVVIGLTGRTEWHPAKMAAYAADNGYLVQGVGTDWRLFSTGAESFGLRVLRLTLNEYEIGGHLREGHPVICSMKPGDFTYTGHFIVLTGMDKEGNVQVNDPNSRIKSRQTWRLGDIVKQVKSAWAYSKE